MWEQEISEDKARVYKYVEKQNYGIVLPLSDRLVNNITPLFFKTLWAILLKRRHNRKNYSNYMIVVIKIN